MFAQDPVNMSGVSTCSGKVFIFIHGPTQTQARTLTLSIVSQVYIVSSFGGFIET